MWCKNDTSSKILLYTTISTVILIIWALPREPQPYSGNASDNCAEGYEQLNLLLIFWQSANLKFFPPLWELSGERRRWLYFEDSNGNFFKHTSGKKAKRDLFPISLTKANIKYLKVCSLK